MKFIIAKYYVNPKGMPDDVTEVWEIIYPHYHSIISAREGREIIRENGLVLAVSNRYGKVWEIPGKPLSKIKI